MPTGHELYHFEETGHRQTSDLTQLHLLQPLLNAVSGQERAPVSPSSISLGKPLSFSLVQRGKFLSDPLQLVFGKHRYLESTLERTRQGSAQKPVTQSPPQPCSAVLRARDSSWIFVTLSFTSSCKQQPGLIRLP